MKVWKDNSGKTHEIVLTWRAFAKIPEYTGRTCEEILEAAVGDGADLRDIADLIAIAKVLIAPDMTDRDFDEMIAMNIESLTGAMAEEIVDFFQRQTGMDPGATTSTTATPTTMPMIQPTDPNSSEILSALSGRPPEPSESVTLEGIRSARSNG